MLAVAAGPASARQQDTLPAPPDSLPAQADTGTIRPDSIAGTRDPDVPAGPLPPGTRLTLTRDSLLWTSAFTLSDLIALVPGVYVARGGFWGQPEYIQYGGRGGSALEVYWDGMPMVPLGQDSLFFDPSRVPLSYLERVDIEVEPAGIRVYLVSERHGGPAARSKVRIVSGPFETAAYAGLFQHRWPNGIGLDLAADFLGSEGARGPEGSDNFFSVWTKLSWLPQPGAGMSYQMHRQQQERPAVTSNGATGVPALLGTRNDVLFSLFREWGPERDRLRLDGGVAINSWVPDSGFAVPAQNVRQAFAALGYQRPNLSARLETRVGDRRTLAGVSGRAGWVPFRGVVLSGNANWRWHEGNRTSRAVHGAAGLYVGPLSLVADATVQDVVQAPALRADTVIPTTDRRVRAAVDARPLSASVALVERDRFDAIAFPALRVIGSFPPTPSTRYVEGAIRLRPNSAWSVGAWYSNPLSDTALAPLQPPTHARADLTLRSKFWPTFRSGAFDFMVQLAMESWSTGTAGLDATGVPIALPGATFWHVFVQFQIVGFTAFWDFRNARLTEAQYVPGLAYPRQAQTFGVTWEFSN